MIEDLIQGIRDGTLVKMAYLSLPQDPVKFTPVKFTPWLTIPMRV